MNIETKKAELARRRLLTQGELARLREEFLVEYTYNSNAIEGNTLTLRETAMVLSGITIDKKPLKEHLEAVGHRDAFLFVEKLVKEKAKFSESIIKQIHSPCAAGQTGGQRRLPPHPGHDHGGCA